MKQIVYKREIPALIKQTPDGESIVIREAYLQTEKLGFTESNKENQITEALKYAYDGKYTIEDDGQPEPEPTELEQLRADLDFLSVMTGVSL